MNFMRRNGLIFFSVVLVATTIATRNSGAQEDSDQHYPYRFCQVRQSQGVGRFSRNPWERNSRVCRVPGRESDGILYTNPRGPRLLGHLAGSYPIAWMDPYPGLFKGEDCKSTVDGVWTFGQHGEPEAVFHVFDPSRFRLLVERHRVRDGELTARFELATGPDRNGDGVWDGDVRVAGVVDVPTPAGPRQALVVLVKTAYDLTRGVRAVAADTGELLWEYLVGPQPWYDNIAIADLDGDGEPAIIFGGGAVGNMHQGDFNGTRDDSTRVFVLDHAGRLLWSRPLAPYSASMELVVADVRGDSLPEIMLGSRCAEEERNGLFLLDGNGALLDSLTIPSGVLELRMIPDTTSRGQALVQDGTSQWLVVDCEHGLKVLARRSFAASNWFVGFCDLVPETGHEILLGGGRGMPVWLLTRSLEPLARFGGDKVEVSPGGFAVFQVDADSTITLLRGPGSSWSFALEKTPRRVPWAMMGGILAVGVAVPAVRRIRKGKRPSAATQRELQLQLLGRLELSGHGAIGGLSAVRRLVWNLDALAQGFTLGEERLGVMQGLMAEIRDIQVPKLHAAVELAGMSGLDPGPVDMAASRLEELKIPLDKAEGGVGSGVTPLSLAQGLKDATEAAESAFQGLRREVGKSFRVEPATFVMQALAAHRDAMEAASVTAETRLDGLPNCCMDGEELAFVIDNLIENALRAMQGGKDPRLTIDWKDGGNWCTLRFADTGCGIVPDDWQRIFEAGQSSRAGGGLGLPRSRELLRKFGGGLMVESSSLGEGTVMAMTLSVMKS